MALTREFGSSSTGWYTGERRPEEGSAGGSNRLYVCIHAVHVFDWGYVGNGLKYPAICALPW